MPISLVGEIDFLHINKRTLVSVLFYDINSGIVNVDNFNKGSDLLLKDANSSDVMEQIKANNPRIGGSCCLYVFGLKDDFRDIDIIVDNINGIDLPYEKIPLIHEKRLNRTLKYMIDNVEIDISESLFYENDVINYIGIIPYKCK